MLSATMSGTPSAVPFRPAKLDRISVRTTPVWFRTLGPFELSAGKGPAVSSGILLAQVLVPGVVGVVGVELSAELPPQPRSCSAPTPTPSLAAIRKRDRRSIAAPVARKSR